MKYHLFLRSAGLSAAALLSLFVLQHAAAQTFNSEVAMAEDYLMLSKSHVNVSVEKAVKYSEEALTIARRINNDSLLGKSYKSLGIAFFNGRMYKECAANWDSALFYFRKAGIHHEEMNVINNLGVVHNQLGNYQTAVDYYMTCLGMKKNEGDSIGVGHIYNNLGALYYELRAFREALPYFEKAKAIAASTNDISVLMHTSNNIGLIQTELNNFGGALESFNESIGYAKINQSTSIISAATQNIGNVYMFRNESDSALKYFHKGLELSEKIGSTNGQAYLGIGWCWYQKGEHDKALFYFKQAYSIGVESGDLKLKLDAIRNIYKTSADKGKQPDAYQAAVQYIELFDSVKNMFDSTAILNLQAKYLVNEKMNEISLLKDQKNLQDKQLALQKSNLHTQKALLHLSLTALILFSFLVILLVRLNRKYRKTSIDLETQNQINLKNSIELQIINKTLSEQEEILRTLLETSPDTILLKDGNGRWIKCNQAMLDLFDLEGVDYQMKTDRDLAALKPFYKEAFESCMISDEMTWYKKKSTRGDEIIPVVQGGFRIIDVIKVALFNADGSRKGLIIIGRDVTQRKETELQLNTALTKAEESDRLKSAFLRNISHEIRTPLNAIIGFSDLLIEEIIPERERFEYLNLIQQNGNNLLTLINDIIDISQIEAGTVKVNYTQFDLVTLLSDEHKHFRQILDKIGKKKLAFDFESESKSLLLFSDQIKIRQILVNLLNNAMKFTDEGRITLKLAIGNRENSDPNWVRIEVTDTGTGIPEGKKEYIFDQFTKFSDSQHKLYGGAGLGLSIVQKNVKILKGNIEVDSEPGKGTTLIISLPLIAAKGKVTENRKPKAIPDYSGKTILITEDVQSSFELLIAILKPTGATLLHARNGLESINFCEKQPEIDLVLMDIQLPLMNGYEATRRIKAFRPLLPIIAQTAFAMPDEKEACMNAGCDGYFTKPLKAELLLPVLNELLDNKSSI